MESAVFTVKARQGVELTITAPSGTSKRDVARVLSHRTELKQVEVEVNSKES